MTINPLVYAYVADEVVYQNKEHIIREGTGGGWIYIILEGKARVKKITSKGMVTIDTLHEGDLFGEMILWQSGKGIRTASVIAEGTVKLGLLETEKLIKDYELISPRLKSLLRSLIIRLKETTSKATSMAVESA